MGEKRVIIAVALSFLVLVLWQKVVMPRYAPPVVPAAVVESAEKKSPTPTALETASKIMSGDEKLITLENQEMKAVLTSRGAAIQELMLKTFSENNEPVYLVRPNGNTAAQTLSVDVVGRANLEHVPFELVSSSAHEAVYRFEKSGEFRLTKRYRLQTQPAYGVQVEFQWDNLSNDILRLEPQTALLFFSGASHASIDTTALHVLGLRGDQMVSKGAGKIKKGVYEIGPLSWVGLEKKYFSLLLKEDQTLESLQAKMEGEDHWLLQAKLTPIELAGHQSQTDKLLLYAGPTRLTELKAYGVGFEKVFSQGWLGFLHVVFLWLLNFFFRFLHNFGLAILALTLLIRIILSPLMHFSFDSMKKMQDVQPKIEALKQQYNKDPQKLNQEMMELFKRNKVNPFGGCLPMVIQIPIFIALWQVLSHSIELKGAPFYFWITDLSLQDHLFTLPFTLPWFGNVIALLPILTTITMLLQQMLTPTTTSAPEQKMMMWMMSVIFGVMFYKLPSGVLLYWCASNIITIIHQMMLFKKGPFRPRPA